METEKVIRKLPYWEKLTDSERDELARNTAKRLYNKGEYLTGLNESCLGMIYILNGSIRTLIISEEDREITLFRLRPGASCTLSASCVLSQVSFETEMIATDETQIIFFKFNQRLAHFLLSACERSEKNEITMTKEDSASDRGAARICVWGWESDKDACPSSAISMVPVEAAKKLFEMIPNNENKEEKGTKKMSAPRDLRGASRAHLMLGNSITDVDTNNMNDMPEPRNSGIKTLERVSKNYYYIIRGT